MRFWTLTRNAVALASLAFMLAAPALAQAQETTDGAGNAEDDNTVGALAILLIFILFAAVFAGIIAVIVFIFRYVMKRNKERIAAMQAYAQQRGLVYEGDGTLPRCTPLLQHNGRALGKVSGTLADGLVGTLANYQYTVGTKDNRRTYFFSTVLAPLPEAGSARFYCYRRAGDDFFDPIGDALTQFQTVELESAQFSRSFRLMVKDEANMVAIRQLFSPSFIVFLSEEVPPGFWFEVEDGHLVGAVEGDHWEQPVELDAICTATAAVATRIRNDISERLGLRGTTAPAEPPPPAPDEPPPPPPIS